MRYFLVMWDCNGLETLQDITEHHPDRWAEAHLFESIKNSKVNRPAPPHIQALMLRARYNSHRNYEIYIQQTDDGVTAEEFAEAFDRNPQHWADWIREHHSVKLWDDRAPAARAIV